MYTCTVRSILQIYNAFSSRTNAEFEDFCDIKQYLILTETNCLFVAVCIGTNSKLSAPQNLTRHLETMKSRYENCTYVQGNLELTFLRQNDNTSFLRQIREVTGYVLIFNVDKEDLSLPSLRIIRGRTLFGNSKDMFSLWVAANRGLQQLGLNRLREIMDGDIRFLDNPSLCHVGDTVDWKDIVADGRKQKVVHDPHEFSNNLSCSTCPSSCEEGLCWGPSSEMCQKSKIRAAFYSSQILWFAASNPATAVYPVRLAHISTSRNRAKVRDVR